MKPAPVGLVLEGGAMRGLFTAGITAIQQMSENYPITLNEII